MPEQRGKKKKKDEDQVESNELIPARRRQLARTGGGES